MKNLVRTSFLALALTVTSPTVTLADGPAKVKAKDTGANVRYPAGYRQWQHVKSMVIQEGHPLFESFGGIHHLYANPAAMTGYAKGKFPDGAVIAFDLLAAQTGGNAIQEGERKVLGVMVKDQRRFAATGGWGFEGFAGGDPAKPVVKSAAATACYACHAAQASSDYVFSKTRK